MTKNDRVKELAVYFYNHHFVRYLFVGGTTFILAETTLIVLHGGLKVWLPLATAIAYTLSFIYNFTLNRWWTFSAADNKNLKRHLVTYGVLFVFNLGVTFVGVPWLSHYISYAIAYPIVVVIQTSWNFLIYKYVIFTKTEHKSTIEDTTATTSKV